MPRGRKQEGFRRVRALLPGRLEDAHVSVVPDVMHIAWIAPDTTDVAGQRRFVRKNFPDEPICKCAIHSAETTPAGSARIDQCQCIWRDLPIFGSPFVTVGLALALSGGEGGIRTHEPREGPPVFKTGAINRSATSPETGRECYQIRASEGT